MKIIYTLAGYRPDRSFSRCLDKDLELKRFEAIRYPVEAYRALCEEHKWPYPLDDAAGTAPAAPAAPQTPKESSGAVLIVDGLTVEDVRAMCQRSPALASALRAVSEWQAIEKENPARMTEDALRSKLRIVAKRDKWGSDIGGEIAPQKQEVPLMKLFTNGWQRGGRPKK